MNSKYCLQECRHTDCHIIRLALVMYSGCQAWFVISDTSNCLRTAPCQVHHHRMFPKTLYTKCSAL
jgi:hypothetical protein